MFIFSVASIHLLLWLCQKYTTNIINCDIGLPSKIDRLVSEFVFVLFQIIWGLLWPNIFSVCKDIKLTSLTGVRIRKKTASHPNFILKTYPVVLMNMFYPAYFFKFFLKLNILITYYFGKKYMIDNFLCHKYAQF